MYIHVLYFDVNLILSEYSYRGYF